MNNSTIADHDTPAPTSSEKGLKMKIKRTKTASGSKSSEGANIAPTSSTPLSSKHEVVKGATGFNSVSSQENSNSSSTSNTSALGPSATSNTASKMANHSPFEKLKQAILEQEKSKQATKQQQKSDSNKDHKGKSADPSTGSRDGGSNFTGVFRGSTGMADGNGSFHSSTAKHQKNDPYEFNVKNEDRIGGGGALPSKKLKTEKDKLEMRDVMTDTSSVSVMTDPDCLGPCEPGTSVVLEGIVWQETENGLLVVNVTWRGKTYVGTLLDATKHEWAPPSFRSDSPQDPDARTPRGGRGKRGRTTMNSMGGRGTRNTRNSSSTSQNFNPPPSPAKSNTATLPAIGEKRKPDNISAADVASPAKKQKFEIGETPLRPNVLQETWFVCSDKDCSKRYRQINALKYHQNNAHKDLLLQVEQSSEHNKTHVRFAGMQQNTAAQTDEKPNREKRNKKKKNKKNRTGEQQQQENQQPQQMEVDQQLASNENSPSGPSDPQQQASKNSPDNVSVKHPRIQLTPVAMQNNSTATTPPGGTRTVTAPIVSVPVGSQSSPPGNPMIKGDQQVGINPMIKAGEGGNSQSLSKEEKKKEKKKKKKEKKEKKLLEQQAQQQENGGNNIQQQHKHTDNNVNKSPNSIRNGVSSAPVPSHVMSSPRTSSQQQHQGGRPPTQQQQHPPSGGRTLPIHQQSDKQSPVKDHSNVNMAESVHSPAYSDISDEGNDNVPVLENEVELAKKQCQQQQQQTIQSNTGQKESSSEIVTKGLQQEPPNLTPVITHTGHSKNVPSGPMQSQVFANKADIVGGGAGRPTNLTLRNTGPPQQQGSNSEMNNRQKEGFSGGVKPPQANEMARPNMAATQKHNAVFSSFSQGYNFNPNGSNKPGQMQPNQDKLSAQKTMDDKSRNRPDQINLGHSPNGPPPKMQQSTGIMERPGEMPRRTVDSNMNMSQKLLTMPPTNSQQMSSPSVNLSVSATNTADISKQASQLNKCEVSKTNSAEQHYKQQPPTSGGMSMTERQSENEKILKENIDIKRQMNEKDKQDSSSIMRRPHMSYMLQQQGQGPPPQHMMSYNHQRYLSEQQARAKTPGGPPPPQGGGEPRESPKPLHHLHSSHPSANNPNLVSRKENSPMASPKTKAELKQGVERKDQQVLPPHHPSHRPDQLRDHHRDISRDHRPPDQVRDLHRQDISRDHRSEMSRDHRGEIHRSDMSRDHRQEHHRLDITRESHQRMDPSKDHRIDPSREPHRIDPSREPHRIDLSNEGRPDPSRDHRMDTPRQHRPELNHRSLERHPSERHMDSGNRSMERHPSDRHMDSGSRSSNEGLKRPPSSHPDKSERKDPPKSPAPAPSMSSPSMSSPVPPQASVPHSYPYGYAGYPPMYPGIPHFMAAYPGHYMPYGVPPQDGKALEMLQQHASQYYNRDQMKAQDLRKLPDRKSPSADVPSGERPNSRNQQPHHPEHKRGESPGLSRASHMPPQHPSPWYMHNGGAPVSLMQPSPQSSSAKH